MEGTSIVVSCVPKPAAGGKKGSKKQSFIVILENSGFYPEDGGQLRDSGMIEDHPILELARNKQGQTEHEIDAQLQPGQSVRWRVDSGVRFDHCQVHTGQHLISAVAEDAFQMHTLSWAMTHEGPATVDLSLPANPPPPAPGSSAEGEEAMLTRVLGLLEERVNALIRENRSVLIHTITRAQYDDPHCPYNIRSRGIPDGVESVRLVEIAGGVDVNTCCGTHVESLGQLQMMKFVGTEHPKVGAIRLSFLTGNRLFHTIGLMVDREKALNKALSTGPLEHEKKVTQLMDDCRAATKSRLRLLDEHTALVAGQLAAQWDAEHPKLVIVHREFPETDYIESLAAAFLARCPGGRILLTCPSAPPPGGADLYPPGAPVAGNFYLIAGADQTPFVQKLGPLIGGLMGGRGGGKGARYQGKGTNVRHRVAVLKLMEDNGL